MAMTGSVLDVCLALLLVSAAAVTLVGADGQATRTDALGDGSDLAGETGSADDAVAVLATTTAAIEYDLGSGSTTDPSPAAARVAHGTLAEHLARVAVRSATLDGTTLSPATADYRRGVRAAVNDAVGSNIAVRVRWRPVAGAGLAGDVRVGGDPPSDASVSAARIAVPVPGATASRPNVSTADASASTPDRHRERAAVAVATLFPPDRIAATARGDDPGAAAVRERYRRADSALGTDALEAVERGSPRAANRRLAAALATRARDADDTGGSAAAGAATRTDDPVGTVVIVVRAWSA
ncbi:hypothetical protein Hbl1158_07390 [Halobaculum sp. CBA1158]|uniref:DUF7284 family protein n=1 Tax=Halobaculum sp. CBA1158 TaxID=2904243 RepID=UPI001F1E7C7D|nr:hypothetical protein [Halobaculum sp. CBA1158]UIP01162.1 hypothetical protein Hbl1158_07390 [Halobaculum sp. CBA1158]